MRLSRRSLLQLALTLPLAGGVKAALPPQRIAVLDWGLTELLLSLGVTPLAVSAPQWYRQLIGLPTLPAQVQDIGLLFQPNLEALYGLKPDLIIITPAHAMSKPMLEAIAPTLTLATGRLASFYASCDKLATRLALKPQAARLRAGLDQQLLHTQDALRQQAATPCYLASPVDDLHIRLYGENSFFNDVMQRVGLTNAWRGAVNAQGEAQVEIQQIAGSQHARLLIMPAPGQSPAALRGWTQSRLWRALPLTRCPQRIVLPHAISESGALLSAQRFAHDLETTLTTLSGAHCD
ncbi:iron complex transport system substrate-binding protein [Paramixta manurensis]|uniref:Iron complex transport system substrate-binding protein n=1 Tax=Paramixta manurensis TaxID=2740817 RepID=A0A6M8UE45_9GAMM|nr:iron complex transport system substrate-binding protein [Erwiniaceae bacterium PD-1]